MDGYDLHNRQLRGKVRVLKSDNFDEPLEGAKFEIHNEEGVIVYSGISDENGIVEALLPLGTYKAMEVDAPEDFILDETPQTAVLDADGEVVELTFVNEPEINELPDTDGNDDPDEEEPEVNDPDDPEEETEEPEEETEEPEEEEIESQKPAEEKPELPKIGSIHYSFWTVQGLLLIMGGLLLLKKRKTA